MANEPSGVGPGQNHIPSPESQKQIEQKGEFDSQSVTKHAPGSNQLDRMPSQAPGTSLRNRTASTHKQTQSIQSHDLDTIRHLAGEGKWQGVASAIKLHVKNHEQLDQIIKELKVVGELPSEVQNAACEHFSQLQAAKVANIFANQLPDSPKEKLSTLMILASNPHEHDSPIGSVSRLATDAFIKKHNLSGADRQKAVLNTCEQTYQIAGQRVDQLIAQLKSDGDETLNQQLTHYQNERAIEDNYRREVMAKS